VTIGRREDGSWQIIISFATILAVAIIALT